MEYTIKNDVLNVVISSMGAEMISVKYLNKERLWQNDNNTWTGHAPVLFPVCGKINYTLDGINYPLLQHGFARKMEFDLVEKDNDYIKFLLKDNDDTRKLFPYFFNLYIEYKLDNNCIKEKYTVINNSKNIMYMSIGGHTSFSLDNDISNYKIVLKDDTTLYSKIVKDGIFDGTKELVSTDGVIDLSSKLLDNSETIIMDSVNSRYVSLLSKDNKKIADLEFDNFKHLLLWHPINSKMICIEPWNNLVDDSKDSKDIKDKYTIIKIEPNKFEEFNQKYIYY